MKKFNRTTLRLFLLFLVTLFFNNCQNEEYEKIDKPTSLLQTVPIDDAIQFLKQQKSSSLTSKSAQVTTLDYDYNHATQEEITNSTQLLTVIPLLTNNTQEHSRVLMVKIQNELKTVVYSMYPETTMNTANFSGTIMIRTLDGEFINGYRVKNGENISQFFSTALTNKSSGAIDLKEVVIQNNYHAPNYYVSFITIFQMGSYYYNNIYTQLYRNTWNYGGGGGLNYGYTTSGFFDSYPCDQLKKAVDPVNTNNMMPSIEWLKTKVNAAQNDKEFGVEVKMRMNPDETYTNLYTPIESPFEFNVALTTGGTNIGGWHSHPKNGVPMFSFADVRFLALAYSNASEIRKEAVFHGIVTNDNGSVNIYVIKVRDAAALQDKVDRVFNASIYSGKTEEEKYDLIHKKQAKVYSNNKGYLEKSFLEQFNDYGIELYKMSQTTIETKWNKLELNTNKTAVNSIPCN
ncbi:hypothetical protein [Flavobacterium sp. N2038]|uniref:hypothetical protein n=1 Tax=Flavobacterium sp. N2038 TaxID=2986829 RepID=UPI0022249561|nr:hypothetical protein [Flavobacterium sp. N2038]